MPRGLLATATTLSLILLAGAAAAQGQGPARVVTDRVAERVVSRTVTAVGSVDYGRIADVASEVSGVLEQIAVRAGQTVARGDLLAKVNTELTAKDIEITRSEMGEVRAELDKQRSILKRREALMRNNATSRDAFDDAFYGVQGLERRLESLRQRVERFELTIRKSALRAPFDGVVLEKYRELGEAVDPRTPVARVASTEDVEIRVPVSQDLLVYQRPGNPITVSIDALGRQVQGELLRIDPVADLRSKNLLLRIKIPHQTGLLQNLTARVEVPASHPASLRLLKRDAVVRFQGQDYVYSVEQGSAKMLSANIVARLGDLVAVDDPHIRAGMTVVVDGNQRLQPDQAVAVVDR